MAAAIFGTALTQRRSPRRPGSEAVSSGTARAAGSVGGSGAGEVGRPGTCRAQIRRAQPNLKSPYFDLV
ncbi:hypothetical protein NDU88_003635 [Pleurodeles waltl]|uniref:Uncharacterized protein n=1 Tax=Pleurodeles waltl TaxID=8319 RepID=A0AAV7W2Q9_PLEWA|nr:hypothetical protein NDU88_003635 [Pleurodeles waltl]